MAPSSGSFYPNTNGLQHVQVINNAMRGREGVYGSARISITKVYSPTLISITRGIFQHAELKVFEFIAIQLKSSSSKECESCWTIHHLWLRKNLDTGMKIHTTWVKLQQRMSEQ